MLCTGIEKIEGTGTSFTLGLGFGWRAEAHALADQGEDAQLCAEKSFALAKIGERWGETVAHRALAITAAKKKLSDWNKVNNHMGESLRLAKEGGTRPEQALNCLHYAELLRDKGDMVQAKKYLNQAIDLFKEINMNSWLEQAKESREGFS